MIKTLSHLFTPQSSNNYKAKALHLSSLSVFILLVMITQLVMSFIGKNIPGVLGLTSNITADQVIELTNQQRQSSGLQPLTLDKDLIEAATQKGADMIAKNYWAHTSPDGKTPWDFFQNVNYKYLYAGENLARDFMESDAVVDAWMNSSTHRDNLLSSRYQEIGIAVIEDTFQGQPTTLVIQMFGTRVGSAIPLASGKISETAEAVLAQVTTGQPFFSSFHLTKSISISLTLILLAVIILDTIIITKKKIIRLSGKGLAHLVFLGILLIILLGIQPGLIL